MLNGLIAWVLNTYLGKYLENFNPDQLSIAMVSGEVELENVPIRKDALRSFGIPIQVMSGCIGKIKLQIPVRQFRTTPWCIVIEKVYGVFAPKDLEEWDSEKELFDEYVYKLHVLDAKEAKWRVESGSNVDTYYSSSYTTWFNYGATVVTNILENLELKINDVHLRYEDASSSFAIGICIKSFTAQSCDANWKTGSKINSNDISYKISELNDLYMYWNHLTNTNLCSKLQSRDLLEHFKEYSNDSEHNKFIKPINATAKFKRQRCKQAIHAKDRPRISCDVFISQVKLNICDIQYNEMISCYSYLQNISRIRKFRICRPRVPVIKNAIAWWRYALKCHGFIFHNDTQKWCIIKDNLKYIKIYIRYLANLNEHLTNDEKLFKMQMEKTKSLSELQNLRDVCYQSLAYKNPSVRNRNISHGKGILYHWFPNWWGWYKTSDTNTNEDNDEIDETYKNIEDDILIALKETIENDSFSKRDAVFAYFTFKLSDGEIALNTISQQQQGQQEQQQQQSTMLDMKFQSLFSFVEIKPKFSSYRIGVYLGSVSVIDRLTPSTEFPYLIRPQALDYNFSVNGRYTAHPTHTSHTDIHTTKSQTFTERMNDMNDSNEPWFQLQYEKIPSEHNFGYRLIIKSKSLDVVYNESTWSWLIAFFTKPFNNRLDYIYETNEHSSSLKFLNNWKNMFMLRKDNKKKWYLEIDIFAPRIICVENFYEKNTSIILIDFGRFQLLKCDKSSNNGSSNTNDNSSSGGNNEVAVNSICNDSDNEMYMTPCATPPGSQISRCESQTGTNSATILSKFVINSDTGLENISNNLNDRYIITLTDLQVLVCKNQECNYASYKSSSKYHLLDKFSISLQLERCKNIWRNPDNPSWSLFGTLPKMVAHINEQNIMECLKILTPIKFDLFSTSEMAIKTSMNFDDNKMNASTNDMEIDNSDETNFQFVIDQMILEIQNQEKSIVELQVVGIKAGILKTNAVLRINMTVHGLLLVDAIQSFGRDFELLVASHRHVEIDSISGSIKQCELCSATPLYSCDSNMYQECSSSCDGNSSIFNMHSAAIGDPLILIEIQILQTGNEPKPVQIAQVTFNNLDIIANQETIVELIGFANRVFDYGKCVEKSTTDSMIDRIDNKNDENSAIEKQFCNFDGLRSEVSFVFHRLNIFVIRSVKSGSTSYGRKIGTFTMCDAQIHATIGSETYVRGELGGIQIIQIKSDSQNNQRIFSVGKDAVVANHSQIDCNDYRTLHCLANDVSIDSTGPTMKNIKNTNALSFKIYRSRNSTIKITVRMASVWYTHCPDFIEDLYLCVKEFKQYLMNFLKSLGNKASTMAKGVVLYIASNNSQESLENEFIYDIIVNSPVLVLPKSLESTDVLVANLGKIKISNIHEAVSERREMGVDSDNDSEGDVLFKDSYYIDVRNINLYSLDITKRANLFNSNQTPKAELLYTCNNDGIVILHDTALLFQCVYETRNARTPAAIRQLFIEGSVTNNLCVSLSQSQYDQVCATLQYASSFVWCRPENENNFTQQQLVDADETLTVDNDNYDNIMDVDMNMDLDMDLDIDLDMDMNVTGRLENISIQFSVPVLQLDLKNEYNIQLINITFNEFCFKINQSIDERELQILLHSILMEDLKCSPDSKHRIMIDSSDDVKNSVRPHFINTKSSVSCPNLHQLQHINLNLYTSLPSNLNINYCQMTGDTREGLRNTFKQIQHFHVFKATKSTDDLVIYKSVLRKTCDSPNVYTINNSIDFNCLNLVISVEKWLAIFSFLGLISYESCKEEEIKQPHTNYKKLLHSTQVTVNSLNLILVRNDSELAKANLSNVLLKFQNDEHSQTIDGHLGSISILDLTYYGKLYQEKFSTTNEEALSFSYKKLLKQQQQYQHQQQQQQQHHNDDGNDNDGKSMTASMSLNKNAFLVINMSSVKYVHTKRFIMELNLFIGDLLQLKSPVLSTIKYNAKHKNKINILRMGLNIYAAAPIIILPVSYHSNHVLIANLGKLKLGNNFKYANDVEDMTSFMFDIQQSDIIIDIMHIDLDNINLFTGERITYDKNVMIDYQPENDKMIRIGSNIIKIGNSIFKEECYLKVKVMRNATLDKRRIADVTVKGTLSELNCLIDLKQYKLLRGFLNHNLGEVIDDVYYYYQANLNESIERLSSLSKINVLHKQKVIWKTLSINFILENVTIYLAEHTNSRQDSLNDITNYDPYDATTNAILACIKFIKSTLKIDSFSNGKQDIDLISSEILILDARDDSTGNCKKNVFKHILQPSIGGSLKHTVQAEVHTLKYDGLIKYIVMLNNMRIMAILDFLEKLQNFINEAPYSNSDITEAYCKHNYHNNYDNKSPTTATAATVQSKLLNHHNYNNPNSSMVMMAGDDNYKMEFILNITNSEIVFVENTDFLDTNVIILKSTTVLSYKPHYITVPISIVIDHLEIFSCIFNSENDSSLSIIDPFTLNMELRNNCFQIVIHDQLFVRLSYNDVILLTRIMRSIPKQTGTYMEKKQLNSQNYAKISPLVAMGFQQNDCWHAMEMSNFNLNEAAIWLSQQRHRNKTAANIYKLNSFALNANCISLCIIDDCLDADVPLLEFALSQLRIEQKILNTTSNTSKHIEGEFEATITSEYYNRPLSGWEPVIEQWECAGTWNYLNNKIIPSRRISVQLTSKQILKVNITSTLIDLCDLVRKNWLQDYYGQNINKDNTNLYTSTAIATTSATSTTSKTSTTSTTSTIETVATTTSATSTIRRRNPFVPFALKNLTGEPLLFKTFCSQAAGITRTEANQQDFMCNWISAQHNEIVPFDFGPKSKLRHLNSHKINMHRILVQIHGWILIGPISIDKVGTLFRITNLDMQYNKKIRIVFDISLFGSAQKLITVRSAVNLVNRTSKRFFIRMQLKDQNESAFTIIEPSEKVCMPLLYVDSAIYLKPYQNSPRNKEMLKLITNDRSGYVKKDLLLKNCENDDVHFCTKAILLADCLQDISQDIYRYFSPRKISFHTLIEVRKDKYSIGDMATFLPSHTITILPPLIITNLLCCDIVFKIHGCTEGRINASKDVEIYSIDINEGFSLCILLDNYKVSGELKIPTGLTGIVEPKLKLIDSFNRELCLRVSIQFLAGRGMEIYISAPVWITNKTGLPLIVRQEGTNRSASGQFEEHEYARMISPLMFSFSDTDASPLLEIRLGNSYGENNPWCKSFRIFNETSFRQLRAEKTKFTYNIGINVKRGKGLYCCTTFVTLSPHFQLYNGSIHKLEFTQKCNLQGQNIISKEKIINSLPGSSFPFHWPDCDKERLLCVRIAEKNNHQWSYGLAVNETKSLYINIRNDMGGMSFLRLEVILYYGTYFLHFTDAQSLPPPLRIDNYSEISIYFHQKFSKPYWRTAVKPKSSMAYVLDDPLGHHILHIEAPDGNYVDYPLTKANAAKSVTYANFIYIAFKETFNSSSIYNEEDTHALVLGVKDRNVIITRKCAGDRSQLWLMNSNGQLEHEGSSPPSVECTKNLNGISTRLVLDLESPPDPNKFTKLVISPLNNQKSITQTWRFERGRLICHANMCVQALNGVKGLRDGCDAVLGKFVTNYMESNDAVPVEQNIEIQKLRPGSGHLEIYTKMDGPIQCIQIHDVKAIGEKIDLNPDPHWSHRSLLNKAVCDSLQNTFADECLIKFTLLKGLGISIVTSLTCEELAYITLENIMLDITLLPISKSLDLKVGDFQIDNQLLDTPCPILLYTSKSKSEEITKEAFNLQIKLLSSPNENAIIFQYITFDIRPCVIYLEERLILKMAIFLKYKQMVQGNHHPPEDDKIFRFDDNIFSKNSKRYYFENLSIGSTQIRLTVLTASKLSAELLDMKNFLGLTLIKFEDAVMKFDKFSDRHHFETWDVYLSALKTHYMNQLKWHTPSILGSVDFLGNPLGFANDVSVGVSGLLFEGSVTSLVKNVTHGISNSTAKLTETLSDSLGWVVLDDQDNETRQKILDVAHPTTSRHLAAGLKGFGFGLLGGVTSIIRHTYSGAQTNGFPGFISGLGKGLVGTVTKPIIGVLDLTSETANAVRETSRGSHHFLPERKRPPRCVEGPSGGLLSSYSYRQSIGQRYLYILNQRNFNEKLIFYEPNLCNDKEAKLRLLVSTEFIRIFSKNDEDPQTMFECHLSEVLSCHPLTTSYYPEISANISSTTKKKNQRKEIPSYYIEISTNHPKITRPRVRCENEEIAEKASRYINYAKAVFDEREPPLLYY